MASAVPTLLLSYNVNSLLLVRVSSSIHATVSSLTASVTFVLCASFSTRWHSSMNIWTLKTRQARFPMLDRSCRWMTSITLRCLTFGEISKASQENIEWICNKGNQEWTVWSHQYLQYLRYEELCNKNAADGNPLNASCYNVKVKVELSLCFVLIEHHVTKTYWVSGGIAPHILDLGTRLRWVVSFTPRPLYPQKKSPWYPLYIYI
jgi:hypothetical protein